MNKKILSSLFICFLIAGTAVPSSALMLAMSTRTLTQNAETVVYGEVEEVEALWGDNNEIIFTRATVRVHEYITAPLFRRRITVEYPGGEIDGIGMGVSDGPRMETGEEVILFVKSAFSFKRRFRSPVFSIFGAAQGKYSVGYDGRARKGGFSVLRNESMQAVDTDIDVVELIEKIRQAYHK